MCGEKIHRRFYVQSRRGSPPHVRGKGFPVSVNHDSIRITPACAGKSDFFTKQPYNVRDHPRMCGEKLAYNKARAQQDRITPACAGKRPEHSRTF